MSDDRQHALVIGAGLAGAAVCSVLARRGWRTTLLETAAEPACGASGLPVGMLSAHVTRSPTPLSRLCALGLQSTLSELRRLVPPGAGWQACEVDNLQHDPGRWPAALVRPGALVQAWLHEARDLDALTCRWNASVHQLRPVLSDPARTPPVWQALDERGLVLAEAPVVVVAAAMGSANLLASAPTALDADALPLRPVKGQMSMAALDAPALAERPQRQDGVFVPSYSDPGLQPRWPSPIWAVGSTYQRGASDTEVTQADHERNARRLQAIQPEAAHRLRALLAEGCLLGWSQVRCASLDRLPLVGAAPDVAALRSRLAAARIGRQRMTPGAVPRWPGLHLLCAMGSRGITLAHWCAEQLALQMAGEPPATDQDLLDALDPARFALKQARRQGARLA